MDKHIKVGLTGGIGTGKTTVAGMLEELGAEVTDADRLAHSLLRKGSKQYREVVKAFGKEILDRGGRISRKRLAERVFGRPRLLARLNRIIHPGVLEKLKARLEGGSKPVRVAAVPLLYEVGLEDWFDYVVVVAADKKNVRRRLSAERGMKRDEIEKRRRAQWSLSRKRAKADLIIDNNGSLAATRRQVAGLWKNLAGGPVK